MPFAEAFQNKRVLVTGHTGFKGAWLSEWLLALGAQVTGFAEAPPTQPALFEQIKLADRIRDVRGDVRDAAAVLRVVRETAPHFVFHLAAQSLVRRSYVEPVETYGVNVMGTVNVLEAARKYGQPCTVIAVTTDKCYENREWEHSYREEDPMGGHDPYSSSKGAAELVISAYRRSFFSAVGCPIRLASVRAGNVIGGGDWALDRIVPDCIRALARNEAILVRNKIATRPWQHVLEPLSGYLWLAARLATTPLPQGAPLRSAFNFGPSIASNRTVAELVDEILRHWPGAWKDVSNSSAQHEASRLNLSTDKAFHLLKWTPVWDFSETIRRTVEWYRTCAKDCAVASDLTRSQIEQYMAEAKKKKLAWAQSNDA